MSQAEWQSPGVRRIVTAHDPRGLAGIRSDEVLQTRVSQNACLGSVSMLTEVGMSIRLILL